MFPTDWELELYAEVGERGTIGKAIARIISVATTCVTLKPLSPPPPLLMMRKWMRRRGGVGAAAAEKVKEESLANEVALRNLSSNRILTSLAPRLDLEQPVALAAFTA